jgi:hypothetical protein
MDQINKSTYPVSESPYTVSSTLSSVGIFLFLATPVRYMIAANAEESMILTAYSFFFFLASFLTQLCCSDINDD